MTEFKHQSIEVPVLDQTHENFDKWLKWVEEKRAEIDLLLIQKMVREIDLLLIQKMVREIEP
jgi:hypothetical protein